MKKCTKNRQNGMKKLYNTIFKAYPIVLGPVRKENLLLLFVNIFHGASFAVVIIMTQIFFDALTDGVGNADSKKTIMSLAALLLGCQILSQILNGFTNFYEEVIQEKCYGKLLYLLQHKMTKIAPIEFEKNEFLDDVNKAESGAKYAFELVNTVNSIFSFYIPYFGVMALYMAKLNPMLIISVLLVFVPVLITNYVRLHYGDLIEQEIAPLRRETETYENTLTSLDCYKETRVLGAAKYFISLYKDSIGKWNNISWSKRKKEALIHIGLSIFSFIMYGIILLLLVYLCVIGKITVGSFAAVFASIDVMFTIMDEVFYRCMGDAAKNAGPVNNFLNLMTYPETAKQRKNIDRNDITLKNVTFRYPDSENNVLEDISVSIKENETVAVVGENGAGKTTLGRILLGIYQPDCGEVIIGGEKTDAQNNVFSDISAVFQKFNRYKFTLPENVVISDITDKKDYQTALDKVDKHMNIDKDAVLSRDFGGVDISGGQWQKIGIARGAYKDSKIILLDEPTSAIDPIHESELYHCFMDISRNKTSIIITHRLGITRLVDRIIVMRQGKIAETGNYQELMDKKGIFYSMWSAQADWYQN